MEDKLHISDNQNLSMPVVPPGQEDSFEAPRLSSKLPEGLSADRLLDLGAVYQALAGDSIVDSTRSYFQDRSTVERFLRLCCPDPHCQCHPYYLQSPHPRLPP